MEVTFLSRENHSSSEMSPIVRPSLDQYFMEIATVVAKRSTCLRNQVGAVFVKNKRILSTGYNGAPAGLDHCDRVGCARENVESGTHHELCRAVHAEQNAVADAARRGSSVEGCVAYVTHFPCINCAKILASAGIRTIKYHADYHNDPLVSLVIADAGVDLVKL